jgi:hypothetical protein
MLEYITTNMQNVNPYVSNIALQETPLPVGYKPSALELYMESGIAPIVRFGGGFGGRGAYDIDADVQQRRREQAERERKEREAKEKEGHGAAKSVAHGIFTILKNLTDD